MQQPIEPGQAIRLLEAVRRECGGKLDGLRAVLTLLYLSEVAAVTQRELQDRLGLVAPDCSRLVGRLRDAGLLDQQIDPDNRIHRLLTLTPEGRQLLQAAGVAYPD